MPEVVKGKKWTFCKQVGVDFYKNAGAFCNADSEVVKDDMVWSTK